jgi:hypothetical protein
METSWGRPPYGPSGRGPEGRTDAALALEVRPAESESYPSIVERVAYILVERNPWRCRPWELLIASEADSAFNRAIGFWQKHGADLGAHADAMEARVVVDGWIRTAASNPIDDAAQLVAALSDPRRMRFRAATLLPTNSDQVERVLEAVLAIPPDTDYRFVGGLAALATAEQCCIMVKDETERHEPCLVFHGDRAELALIRSALDTRA